jgi:hypothetical protein
MRVFLSLIATCCLLMAVGCTLLESPRAELKPFADDFAKRLRWADYSGAQLNLATRHQESFQREVVAHGQDLKFSDVHFEGAGFPDAEGRKPMELVLEYYLLPSTEVKTARVALEWVYLDYGWTRAGIWLIDSDFPPLP